MELKHFSMNLSVSGTPGAIIVRSEPMAWRKHILPAIKKIAEEVAGRPVRWADINVFECLEDTPEKGEEAWNRLLMSGKFWMFRIDQPGHLENVSRPIDTAEDKG